MDDEKLKELNVQDVDYSELVKLSLDIGEHMLMCGGEVDRVEDTISRICGAYGAKRTDVFSITSVTFVTATWDDGTIISQCRRVSSGNRDFNKLGALNDMSRRICRHEMPFDEAQRNVQNIIETYKRPVLLAFVGSILAAGGFAMFFGGTFRDCIAAMIAGFVIFAIETYIYNNRVNKVMYYMLASFVAGIVSIATVYIGLGQNIDKIMIGCIMLVIPGMNFTSAVEDILVGDTATGALKLCESILLACSIAGGFAFSVYLCGGLNLL